mgnify:CR=1 FL=1
MGIPNLGGWNPIGQVGGLLRSLPVKQIIQDIPWAVRETARDISNFSSRIPTALNPLATRIPTTRLGQFGKLINPLNPVNFAGYAASALLPDSAAGDVNAALMLPGVLPKVAGLTVFGSTPLAAGTLDAVAGDPRNFPSDNNIGYKSKTGKGYWAGNNYGWQSPESFNKLFGTRLPTGAVSPPPEPAAPPADLSGSWQQAGQLTPPAQGLAPRLSPGIVSTGAGVPAQRQNVQERALSQEVLNAAQQYAAPASVPLSSFYAGQQQLGRSMEQTGELQRRLKELGGAAGMTDQALMAWTQQNPGLAYRELMKLQQRTPQM